MDVGLVCDACHTFNAMGARACIRCGELLSLEAGSVPVSVAMTASGGAMAAAVPPGAGFQAEQLPVGPIGSIDELSRPTLRHETQGSSPHSEYEWSSVPLRLCAICGEEVEPGFRFCGSCGSVMQEETRPAVRVAPPDGRSFSTDGDPDMELAAGASAQAGGPMKRTRFFGPMQAARAKLVLIKGDGLDGVSYTLAGEEHLAGRSEEVPLLFPEDPFMSPVHANFFYRASHLVVRDEDSINGVFIRIRGSVTIDLGDRFLV